VGSRVVVADGDQTKTKAHSPATGGDVNFHFPLSTPTMDGRVGLRPRGCLLAGWLLADSLRHARLILSCPLLARDALSARLCRLN
jgi:hypothetical protein